MFDQHLETFLFQYESKSLSKEKTCFNIIQTQVAYFYFLQTIRLLFKIRKHQAQVQSDFYKLVLTAFKT